QERKGDSRRDDAQAGTGGVWSAEVRRAVRCVTA
ncbi:IS110 family transposase, partial [Escherichia coli H591]